MFIMNKVFLSIINSVESRACFDGMLLFWKTLLLQENNEERPEIAKGIAQEEKTNTRKRRERERERARVEGESRLVLTL